MKKLEDEKQDEQNINAVKKVKKYLPNFLFFMCMTVCDT